VRIANRLVGPGEPVYIVAELSANHNQDFGEAVRLVEAAKRAGADAIKLQTYTADTITIRSNRPEFQIAGGTLWDGRTLHDVYTEAFTPWEWQGRLKTVAEDIGLPLFSTPFDATAVDFLEELQIPAYKIASFELVDLPLIERVAKTGKPLIMSTGMATLDEIGEAVAAARRSGCVELALLKCTSAYPSPPEEMNLRAIPHLAETFSVPIGLSDHTLGFTTSVAAVSLGACVVEKHFTMSRAVPGPDSAFSLEPDEFRAMVDAIRTTEKALGSISYGLSEKEMRMRMFRRSLYVTSNICAGESFTVQNVRSIRPANGLSPKHLAEVVGRRAACDITAGTPLDWTLVESSQLQLEKERNL